MVHDLKSCPFCAGDVSLDHLGSDAVRGWFVECESCGVSQYAENTQDGARSKWNRRAEQHST